MSTAALCILHETGKSPQVHGYSCDTLSHWNTAQHEKEALQHPPSKKCGLISQTQCWKEETQRKECLVWVLFWEGCVVVTSTRVALGEQLEREGFQELWKRSAVLVRQWLHKCIYLSELIGWICINPVWYCLQIEPQSPFSLKPFRMAQNLTSPISTRPRVVTVMQTRWW